MKFFLGFVIALYALAICIIVLYIPYLDISYRYDLHFADNVLRLWHGQTVIAHNLLQTSRYVFPRFWWINYVLMLAFWLYGLHIFCRRYVFGLVKRMLASVSKTIPDARHMSFMFIMLTGFLIISLILEEMALRIAGTYTSANEAMGMSYQSAYEPRATGWLNICRPNTTANSKTAEFTFSHKVNSQGYCDKEWAVKKHTKLRIACIGDSFTQGMGAPADSSYPTLLQDMLQDCEVMNFGVAGTEPDFGYMALKERALLYHPDIVTLTVNASDINDMIAYGGFGRFNKDGTTTFNHGPWHEPLYAHFYIARLILYRQFNIDINVHLTPTVLAAEEKKAIAELEEALDRFYSLCAANNTRCVFIFHPGNEEVRRDSMSAYPVMQYAKSKGYESVDMLEGFKQQGMSAKNVDTYFWPQDGHNKPQGYYLFAKVLQQQLLPVFSDTSSIGQPVQ